MVKSDSKDTITKEIYFKYCKCRSFEISINKKILKKLIYHCFHKNMTQLFSTLIIIRNVSWASNHEHHQIVHSEFWFWNQYIRMISEESCDTEDWSNDAENSALIIGINYSLLYIHKENSYFKLYSYFTIFSVFWSNKCSFGEQNRPKKS